MEEEEQEQEVEDVDGGAISTVQLIRPRTLRARTADRPQTMSESGSPFFRQVIQIHPLPLG